MATQTDFRVKKGLIVGTSDTANPESGTFTYDSDFNTVDLTLDANVNARLAQDHYFYVKAGATITKGDVVYASGAVGNSGKIEVTPYIANNTIEETLVLGVAAEDIATGAFGYVAQFGSIRGLDASGGLTTGGESWTNGAILYASPTYAGELTLTKPSAPNQDIPIAFVVSNNHSAGTIAVRASRLGYHMDEVHDVEITSIADNDLLVYNNSNSRWENGKTIGDLTLTGELNGPATFYIDPAPHDPDTDGATNGLVVIRGDLQVDGTTTTINSTTLDVDDLNITVAKGAANNAAADGAGLTVDGASATLTYNSSRDSWEFNKTVLFNSEARIENTGNSRLYLKADTDNIDESHVPTIFFGSDGGENNARIGLIGDADSEFTGSVGNYAYMSTTGNNKGWHFATDNILRMTVTGNGDVQFRENNGGTPQVGMHWDYNDGRLGIGTDQPAQKLHIENSGFAYIRTTSTSAGGVGFDIGQHTNGNIYLNNRDATSTVLMTSNTTRMNISSGGDVYFYEDGGVNVRMNWDASAEALVLGSLNSLRPGSVSGMNNAQLAIESVSYNPASIIDNQDNATSPGMLILGTSRGTSNVATAGGVDIVQESDDVGSLRFAAADGTDLRSNIAEILAVVTPGTTPAENAVSGDLRFLTTNQGQNTTVRMTITNEGKVGIGTIDPFAQVHSEIDAASGAGAGTSGALWLRNRNQTDGNAATIFWGDDESAAMGAINLMHDSYSNNYGSIDIDTRGTSGYNTKLTITSGGDIIAKNTGLDTYVHRKITNAGSGSATRYIVINKTNIGAAFKFVGKIVGSRGSGVSASNWAMLDVGFDLNNSGQYPKFGVNYQSGYHASLYGHMTAQWVTIDWDDGNGSATWWALQLSSNNSSNWPADLDNMAFSGYVHNVANDSGEIIVIEDATQTITNVTALGRGQTTVFNHAYVGINNTDPVSTLDVRSTAGLGSVFRKDFDGPVADTFSKVAVTLWGQDHDDADVGTGTDQFGPMLGFGARIDDGDPNTGDVRAGISYSYNGDLTFHAKAGASVADGSYERIRIDGATGNVGIGTTNPGKLLTLSRATEAANEQLEFRVVGGISNNNYDGIKWAQGSSGGTTLATQRVHYYTTGEVDMGFSLRNDSNLLYLKRGGNVGIKTSDPGRSLDINGPDIVSVRIRSSNQSSYAGMEFIDELTSFSQVGYIRHTHSDTATATDTGQSGNASFIIGTTEDDTVIGFNSNMSASSAGTNRGSIKFTSSGTTYNTSSDLRLKENIKPIVDGKEKLLAMKPKTFNFIEDENKTNMHGFIAQEMKDIIPEAVSNAEDPELMMSMDYGRITPVIVAALQDALREIEELKTKIQSLENIND